MTSNPYVQQAWQAWCPSDSLWAPWAKPLLFAVGQVSTTTFLDPPALPSESELASFHARDGDSFVIVDVPGATSVAYGLRLAERGYRPVPLYNGVPGVSALVDVEAVQRALYFSAPKLLALALPPTAPPAFLLDSRRLQGTPAPRVFDNRWVTVPEDFPSANRLLAHGLRRCILVRRDAVEDLDHVLHRYESAGIDLVRARDLAPYSAPRPSYFHSLFRRIAVSSGLRRSSAGGFGDVVPEPQSSGG